MSTNSANLNQVLQILNSTPKVQTDNSQTQAQSQLQPKADNAKLYLAGFMGLTAVTIGALAYSKHISKAMKTLQETSNNNERLVDELKTKLAQQPNGNVEKLKEEIKEKEGIIASINQKISDLQTSLQALTSEKTTLQTSYNLKCAEVSSLEQQAQAFEKEKANFLDTISSLEEKLQKSENENSGLLFLSPQLEKAKQDLLTQQKTAQTLQNQINQEQKAKDELNKTLEELRQEFNVLKQKEAQTLAQNSLLQEENSRLAPMEFQLQEANEKNSQLQIQNSQLQEENSRLAPFEKQFETIKQQYQELLKASSQKGSENEAQNGIIETLKTQITQLQADLTSLTNENEQLKPFQSKLETALAQIKTLEQEKSKLNADLKTEKLAKEKLQQSLKDIEESLAQNSDGNGKEIASLKEQIISLREALAQKTNDNSSLTQQLAKANEEKTNLQAKIEAQNLTITNLQKAHEEISNLKAQLEKQVQQIITQSAKERAKGGAQATSLPLYEKMIEDLLQDPKYEVSKIKPQTEKTDIFEGKKVFALSEVEIPQIRAEKSVLPFDTAKFLDELNQSGSNCIIFPRNTQKLQGLSVEECRISSEQSNIVGKLIDTEMSLNYGNTTQWSEFKIARDVMQNFYDGHNHTLDGVRMYFTKQPNGKTKIRIEGNSCFKNRDIQIMGMTSKNKDLASAGSFGEGSKVVVANLLGRGYCDGVRYGSSDWILDFSARHDIVNGQDYGLIQKKLSKIGFGKKPLDGNFIEFETQNEELVNAFINSANYFKHSKNPDFNSLAYDGEKMAFRILDKEQKGNLYLNQRFEYNEVGNFENPLDGFSLIFKERPDEEEYLEIVGRKLQKERDRGFLDNSDIEHLTQYFAITSMDDKEIVQAILATMPKWDEFVNPYYTPPMEAFLKGLIKAAKEKNIMIDFGEKTVHAGYHTNAADADTLRRAGYTLIPSAFSELGYKSIDNVVKELNIHNALQPTKIEKQKLILLQQATEAIFQDTQNVLSKKIQAFNFELPKNTSWYTEDLKQGIFEQLFKDDSEFLEILKKHKIDLNSDINYFRFSDELNEELTQFVNKKLPQELKKISQDPDSSKAQNVIRELKNKFTSMSAHNALSEIQEYQGLSINKMKLPFYVFDSSKQEKETLPLSLYFSKDKETTKGCWIDRKYLETADFSELLNLYLSQTLSLMQKENSYYYEGKYKAIINSLIAPNNNSTASNKIKILSDFFQKLNN